jgi:hypothetical protein
MGPARFKSAEGDGMHGIQVKRLWLVLLAAGALLALPAASLAANPEDVWVKNVGQPPGSGHGQVPHLDCQNINLWGEGLVDSSGSFVINGIPPSGGGEQVYADSWSYDTTQGGDQVLAVIDVGKLLRTAIADGDTPQPNQGFHFYLALMQKPVKHKTFWVNCSAPTLKTVATSATVGGTIQDAATLSGGLSPTGTITWNLYGPGDTSCSTPIKTFTETVSGNGTYTSPTYTTTSTGTYRWIASYSGDANNLSTAGACNDPNEESTVGKASPTLATSASSGTVGGMIQDAAILSGSFNGTGTITWNLYGPGDPTCSAPLQTFTDTNITGDGTYLSPTYTTTSTGTYRWIASYSGDGNNLSTSGACNDPNEQSTVTPATPSLMTDAVSGTVGGSIHDVAHLTGGDNPTGTITWNVYASTDTSCATPLNPAPFSVPVNGDGDYASPDFIPAGAGSYQWVATYSGDGNNVSVSTACGDPNEVSTVTLTAAPGIRLHKDERIGTSGPFTHGPVTGVVGNTVEYEMFVTNTGNTTLVIAFTDTECDAGTLSGPNVISGTYDPATMTLSAGGELEYTCTHVARAGDKPYTNTASVIGTPPSGPPVSSTDHVRDFVAGPGIKVVKLQRDGTSGPFTGNRITANVGDTIDYEIEVTNTGNVPLALRLRDHHCDPGTIHGPVAVSGTLNGVILSAGGVAQYTCSHVVKKGDRPGYTNTATVTGRPPSGPPVHGTGHVVAKIGREAIKVRKLEKVAGHGGGFKTGPLVVVEHSQHYVAYTIDYEIKVTDTGNVPLKLSLSDSLCDPGTIRGPVRISGTLNGDVLSPGGKAKYTCSHKYVQGDPASLTNVATVTGTPQSGPPVHGTGKVTVKRRSVKAKTKLCRDPRTGRIIHYKGKRKPAACRVSRRPHKPNGFTG